MLRASPLLGRHRRHGIRDGRCKRLVEIGDDVVDMLDADR